MGKLENIYFTYIVYPNVTPSDRDRSAIRPFCHGEARDATRPMPKRSMIIPIYEAPAPAHRPFAGIVQVWLKELEKENTMEHIPVKTNPVAEGEAEVVDCGRKAEPAYEL